MLEVVKWKVNPPLYLQSRYLRLNTSQIYPVPPGLTVHHLLALVDTQVKKVKRTTNRANLCINNGFQGLTKIIS